MSAKHSVDGQSLSNELTQLGLPKGYFERERFSKITIENVLFFIEHASGLVRVYDENIDKLTEKLRSSILRCKSSIHHCCYRYFLLLR